MPKQSVIWISRETITACMREADRHYPLETGGTFMGYWSDTREVVVTNMIGPGPGAIHESHNFEPDQEWQLSEIAQQYEASGRRETYLGDWHTHPNASEAVLSRKDKNILRKIINTPSARASKPIISLFCGEPENWKLAACVAHLKRRKYIWDKLVTEQLEVKTYGNEEIQRGVTAV